MENTYQRIEPIEEQLLVQPKESYALLRPFINLFMAGIILAASSLLQEYYYNEYIIYGLFSISCIFVAVYFYQYLFIRSIYYKIDYDQIIYIRGIFSIKTDYIELYRVKDYILIRSFLMRFIKAMTLTLNTSDKSHPEFKLVGIPKSDIDILIRQRVEAMRATKGVFEID
jgi:uncharacterized membrane protein YdbT with pleckstrin-like domain